MRKNFLILMLLTLLPLASWAGPISNTDIMAGSPYYGHLPSITGTGLTEGVHFEVVAYYTDETMSTEVSSSNVMKTPAGTDLIALVRGLGSYDGTIKLAFQIKANALTIIGTEKSKTYGVADPTGNDFFTVTSITDAAGSDVTEALKTKITFGRESGNDVAKYAYTASFTGTEGNLSVSGTPAGTVSQPTFTGDEKTVNVS